MDNTVLIALLSFARTMLGTLGGIVTHIRLCSDVMSADSIVTINEEIE